MDKQKLKEARDSVESWFNESRFIVVAKPVSNLMDDAYFIKKHLLKDKFPDKWESMSKVFQWRFGVKL